MQKTTLLITSTLFVAATAGFDSTTEHDEPDFDSPVVATQAHTDEDVEKARWSRFAAIWDDLSVDQRIATCDIAASRTGLQQSWRIALRDACSQDSHMLRETLSAIPAEKANGIALSNDWPGYPWQLLLEILDATSPPWGAVDPYTSHGTCWCTTTNLYPEQFPVSSIPILGQAQCMALAIVIAEAYYCLYE